MNYNTHSQKNIIQQVTQELLIYPEIKAAILYGSMANGHAAMKSDVDIALLTTQNFNPQTVSFSFDDQIIRTQYVKLRKKIVFYLRNHNKIELTFSQNLEDFSQVYIGSEIKNIEPSILFDRTGEVLPFLQTLKSNEDTLRLNGKYSDILDTIAKFIYEFENASRAHQRSDAYKFYYFYNIALHEAIKLCYWSKGGKSFSFLPKNFTNNNLLSRNELSNFYSLNGKLYLPEANTKKRKLLDFFYSSLNNLPVIDEKMRMEFFDFCEWIYQRDLLWNFRDISTHNPLLKPCIIYRSAQPTIYPLEVIEEIIHQNSISYIFDLRDDDEVNTSPYPPEIIDRINYIRIPIDPRIQDDEFIAMQDGYSYSNDEIAYRFFAYRCHKVIGQFLRSITCETNTSSIIHCVAGRDRTGCIISLIHLLVNTPLDVIEKDYLASEMSTTTQLLHIFLSAIEDQGGIHSFLNLCGLNNEEIIDLQNKLTT